MKDLCKGLEIMAQTKDAVTIFLNILEAEISMPNIPMPTMGGEIFWNTICEYNGWRFQQNMITHHARIINEDDVRIAWGTFNGMERALRRFVEYREFNLYSLKG